MTAEIKIPTDEVISILVDHLKTKGIIVSNDQFVTTPGHYAGQIGGFTVVLPIASVKTQEAAQ